MTVYGFDKKDAARVAETVRRVEHSPLGERSRRRMHKNRGSSGTTTIPIKITAKIDYNTYTADVYADGRDQDPSETGATVRVLDIAETETIPNGTWLMASPLSWPDLDDPAKRKEYLTIDPARSY